MKYKIDNSKMLRYRFEDTVYLPLVGGVQGEVRRYCRVKVTREMFLGITHRLKELLLYKFNY